MVNDAGHLEPRGVRPLPANEQIGGPRRQTRFPPLGAFGWSQLRVRGHRFARPDEPSPTCGLQHVERASPTLRPCSDAYLARTPQTGGRVTEAQQDYTVETFDPLLRDLVGWGLVTGREGRTRTPWRLVAAAQRRLDELSPTVVPAGAVISRSPLRRLPPAWTHQDPWRLLSMRQLLDEPTSPAEWHGRRVATLGPSGNWRRSRPRPAATIAS
jgi:hypothetical protein